MGDSSAAVLDREMSSLEELKGVGRQHLCENDLTGAAKIYFEILRQWPEDLEALEFMAKFFSHFGRVEQAIMMCKKILMLDASHAYAKRAIELLGNEKENAFPSGCTIEPPKTVHFLMNKNCNAKCNFCGGDYWKNRTGDCLEKPCNGHGKDC